LTNTKAAWEGYAVGLEEIAVEFDKAEEEIKKIKKRFNLQAANDDLALRVKIYNDTNKVITGMHDQLNHNFEVMTMTLPDDKKDFVKKEINAVTEKLSVLNRFDERVKKIRDFVENLKNFDQTLKDIDAWMKGAETQLDDVKNKSDTMTPEDRVTQTMDLLEDIREKVDALMEYVLQEEELLPQGDSIPKDAQDYKDELMRIKKYVDDLYSRCSETCNKFSEDVTLWAQYKIGIKIFSPWLSNAEESATGGLSKPQTLDEANEMFAKIQDFDNSCLKHLAILEGASAAANKMTTHKEADDEVKALKERYVKVKAVSDEWMKKTDTLVKEWKLLDNTVNELNSWIGTDRGDNSQQGFSLEKMESTLGELKNIFKEKERLVENL
jgi:DNA repair ATPase RecN